MDVIAGAVLLMVIVGGGLVAGAIALARLTVSGSDIHQHSGSFKHEHSGTIRHELAGEVRHTVQHVGTVQHEHTHRIDPADAARLDRLAEQRELEAAERARAEFEALSRKLDAVELRRRAEQSQVVELRRIRPPIER